MECGASMCVYRWQPCFMEEQWELRFDFVCDLWGSVSIEDWQVGNSFTQFSTKSSNCVPKHIKVDCNLVPYNDVGILAR